MKNRLTIDLNIKGFDCPVDKKHINSIDAICLMPECAANTLHCLQCFSNPGHTKFKMGIKEFNSQVNRIIDSNAQYSSLEKSLVAIRDLAKAYFELEQQQQPQLGAMKRCFSDNHDIIKEELENIEKTSSARQNQFTHILQLQNQKDLLPLDHASGEYNLEHPDHRCMFDQNKNATEVCAIYFRCVSEAIKEYLASLNNQINGNKLQEYVVNLAEFIKGSWAELMGLKLYIETWTEQQKQRVQKFKEKKYAFESQAEKMGIENHIQQQHEASRKKIHQEYQQELTHSATKQDQVDVSHSSIINDNIKQSISEIFTNTTTDLSPKFIENAVDLVRQTKQFQQQYEIDQDIKHDISNENSDIEISLIQSQNVSMQDSIKQKTPPNLTKKKSKKLGKTMKVCLKILQQLKSDANSRPFQYPVDPTQPKCCDYYSHIKKPMDLSTVKNKLLAGFYKNRFQFQKDVCLIWKNSYKYNGGFGCEMYTKTKLMEVTFSKLFQENFYNSYIMSSESSDVNENKISQMSQHENNEHFGQQGIQKIKK